MVPKFQHAQPSAAKQGVKDGDIAPLHDYLFNDEAFSEQLVESLALDIQEAHEVQLRGNSANVICRLAYWP